MFTIEIIQNVQGMWFWHIKGGNGEIVAVSETMHNRADAVEIVANLFAGLASAEVVTIDRLGFRSRLV
jgi:uncharacterized protein YegP (UPF0339 family)